MKHDALFRHLLAGGKAGGRGSDRVVSARPSGFWKGKRVESADLQRKRHRYDFSALNEVMSGRKP